jgi:hypothetical protein
MLNAKAFQYSQVVQKIALGLHVQHNLQAHMHKLGHQAWVFMLTIKEGLDKAMFEHRLCHYLANIQVTSRGSYRANRAQKSRETLT